MLTYEYYVYGMRLFTNWRIPWLSLATFPTTGDPSPTLSIIATQSASAGDHRQSTAGQSSISEVNASYDGGPVTHSTVISDGIIVHHDSSLRKLYVEYAPQRSLDEVSALIFGRLMGYLLREYGRLSLHAS